MARLHRGSKVKFGWTIAMWCLFSWCLFFVFIGRELQCWDGPEDNKLLGRGAHRQPPMLVLIEKSDHTAKVLRQFPRVSGAPPLNYQWKLTVLWSNHKCKLELLKSQFDHWTEQIGVCAGILHIPVFIFHNTIVSSTVFLFTIQIVWLFVFCNCPLLYWDCHD